MLEETAIFFVPIINLDGYIRIGANWDKNFDLAEVRKNSHLYSSQEMCSSIGLGVDLNRNYAFMFGHDDNGSRGEDAPCEDDYRGPSAFSEPET
jgi:hypothetical protein